MTVANSLAEFGRESGVYWLMNTAWAWPVVESLHFVGLCLLLGTVGVYDLRLLGFARGVPQAHLHQLVPWGVAGYCLNVITGSLFLITAPDQYLFNPAFQSKLLFMMIAGINMLVFYVYSFASLTSLAAAPSESKVILRARWAAGLSLLCWSLVIVCGRLITYYRPPYHWCFWC